MGKVAQGVTLCNPDANTLGLIAGVASVDWGLAIQIGAAASIGSDMQFTPSTPQI